MLVKAGSGVMTAGVPDSSGVPAGATEDTLLAVYNDLAGVEKLFDSWGKEIAAVIVEPVGALLVILLASLMTPILPYFLAFAAGAMIYVVVEELIPEASEGQHSNIGTVGFAVGFVLMMVLDVVLG